MYQFFQQCFQQYLSLYSEEIAEDEHLLTLFAPFYGLANPKTMRHGSFPAIFVILKSVI